MRICGFLYRYISILKIYLWYISFLEIYILFWSKDITQTRYIFEFRQQIYLFAEKIYLRWVIYLRISTTNISFSRKDISFGDISSSFWQFCRFWWYIRQKIYPFYTFHVKWYIFCRYIYKKIYLHQIRKKSSFLHEIHFLTVKIYLSLEKIYLSLRKDISPLLVHLAQFLRTDSFLNSPLKLVLLQRIWARPTRTLLPSVNTKISQA